MKTIGDNNNDDEDAVDINDDDEKDAVDTDKQGGVGAELDKENQDNNDTITSVFIEIQY